MPGGLAGRSPTGPPEMITLIPSSTLMSSAMTSSSGTTSEYPDFGLGVVRMTTGTSRRPVSPGSFQRAGSVMKQAIIVLFVAGAAVLSRVDLEQGEREGREAADRAEASAPPGRIDTGE